MPYAVCPPCRFFVPGKYNPLLMWYPSRNIPMQRMHRCCHHWAFNFWFFLVVVASLGFAVLGSFTRQYLPAEASHYLVFSIMRSLFRIWYLGQGDERTYKCTNLVVRTHVLPSSWCNIMRTNLKAKGHIMNTATDFQPKIILKRRNLEKLVQRCSCRSSTFQPFSLWWRLSK